MRKVHIGEMGVRIANDWGSDFRREMGRTCGFWKDERLFHAWFWTHNHELRVPVAAARYFFFSWLLNDNDDLLMYCGKLLLMKCPFQVPT